MKGLFILFFLVITSICYSQVTTDPAIAVESQSVKIIFDATKGSGGLANYTGDVYAHTGVITDKSSSSSDWKYVIAEWTENIEKAKLTRSDDNDNIYELNISPDIRSFYSVPEGEEIKQMAFVFRSADRTKEGKATGNKDIFVDVVKEGLTVSFINPDGNIIIEKDKSLDIEVSTTISAEIELVLNAEVLKSESGSSLNYTYTNSDAGNYWLFANATSGEEVVKDSVLVTVREETVSETQPAGIKKGINYISDTEVTLSFFAPEKESIFVIGDFSNWLPLNEYQMKKDGDTFWLAIDNLESGKSYIYQYLIDKSLRIADPYTEQTSDPWNDQHIGNETYPDLVAYPAGKTEGLASVFQTAQTDYVWEVENFEIPAKNQLVIYEMLIRDYTEEHTYKSIIERLDYLDDLNINVLELMPVNEFEGNLSWGYNPSFYFAPDKYYGPKNELKELIDSCHARGIAVVIDMVLNHSYGQSPFVQMYWDDQNNRPTADNPWYNETSNFQNPDAQWGYDFNHESAFTKELVDSVNSFWINEYKVDGFRFDFTKGFSNTPYGSSSWGGPYDADRISNLKRMADEIWERNENALVILEHLSDNPEEKELSAYGMLLWGNMNHNYGEAAMGYNENKKSDLSWGVYKEREWNDPHLVTYMESHDEERLTYKLQQWGASSGSYDTQELGTALDRMELNSVFLIPIPGPKMIWQFGEVGYDFSIDYNGRLGEKPIRWDYLEDEDRTDLFQVISKLNYLKQTYEEFQTTDFDYSLTGETKWIRLSANENHVVIVGNFATEEKTLTIDRPEITTWYDYFNESVYSTNEEGDMQFTLAPGKYYLLSTRQLTHPDITTEVADINVQDDIKIYPNPATEYVSIDSSDPVELVTLYSIDGHMVRKDYFTKSFNNKISLSGLQSGIYLVSVKTTQKKSTFYLIKN